MKLVTPTSHLFSSDSDRALVLGGSDSLEARPERPESKNVLPLSVTHIHFSDPRVDVNVSWPPAMQRWIVQSAYQYPCLEVASFHLSRDFVQVKVDQFGRYLPLGYRMSEAEMLTNCEVNVEWLRSALPSIDIAIENVNYYATGAYDLATTSRFIRKVISLNGTKFLFDLAHAQVSAANRGESLMGYCEPLPFHSLNQVHLSKPSVGPIGEMIDSHGLPGSYELALLADLGVDLSGELPVTVEFYSNAHELRDCLDYLRGVHSAPK